MSDELAVKEKFSILEQGTDDLKEIIELNVGDDGLSPADLERIEFPSSGTTHWTVPTLEGEEVVDEIEAVLVHHQAVRAYWEADYGDPDASDEPDCYSPDGVHGFGNEKMNWDRQKCANCPMNEWDSAEDGGGKACKEKKNLYFLRPGEKLPTLLRVPPTSLNAVKDYMLKLAKRSIPYYGVVTSISLVEESNDNYDFSKLELSVKEKLGPDEIEEMKEIVDQIKPVLEQDPPVMDEQPDEEAA